jgi:ribosomal protein S27AE
MKNKLKTVAAYRDIYQAYLVKGQLETEGIPAIVVDEYLVGVNWMYSFAIGGVKVKVPENVLDKAQEIIASYQNEKNITERRSGDICPKCSSTSISANRYSLWSLIPTLIFLLPIFFRRKKWVCDNCGLKW